MKLGYIRVSKDQQTTALQEDALRQEQCERLFIDKMSGKRFDRPQFLRMLETARAGDIIVVWRLDRLVGQLAIEHPLTRAAPDPPKRRRRARSRRRRRLPFQTNGVGFLFHPFTVCSNQSMIC